MSAPAVTVVVPALDAAATIARTLEALAAQQLEQPYEVLVLDGGSGDGTREIVTRSSARDPRIRLLDNPDRTPVAARNRGAAAAASELLAFTDADCFPEPGWLSAGLKALQGSELVQGRVVPERPAGPLERTVSVGAAHGLYETANLFVRRSLLERVGGFEPLPGLTLRPGEHFGEDVWFAWRAIRRGAEPAFAADAVVRHAVFPRGIGGYVAEQRRRGYFPALVATVPELRERLLYRRWFLSAGSARFDLAAAGALAALLTRRRLPLAAALPYLAALPREPEAALGILAGDAVGAGALLHASVAQRTPVL